jgi:N-acetylglucosaminyldiphosphoundecaprenol N-acetyl-beta-D-mannosaminyltransferase
VSLDLAVTTLERATDQVLAWSADRVGRYVCAANVHMVMEAFDSRGFRDVIDRAALVVPDGAPLVWTLRLFGEHDARRVFGPDLTVSVLDRAAADGTPVAFYGGTDASLQRLVETVHLRWPALRVAASIAPPFRELTPDEDRAYTEQLANSGARILLVGIGCPKQEFWMAAHADRIACVMLGVGQAFDLLSGLTRGAPRWMHHAGLGWLYRLIHEPRRLWKRYALHNPRFVGLVAWAWLRRLVLRSS